MSEVKWTVEKIKQIKDMRKKVMSCEEIGNILGITKQRVNTLAKRDLNPGEGRETKYSNLADIFVKEYKENSSIIDIAKKYNTVPATVFRILKQKDVIFNKRKGRKPASGVTTV
jgi:IS30 family transposase